MIVTYIRSSSYGCYTSCEFQYLLQYVFGWKTRSGKKADIGTISHKIMEFYAKEKLAKQNNQTSFFDDESQKTYIVGKDNLDEYVKYSWDYYTKGPAKHHEWNQSDLKQIYNNIYDYLNYRNGLFNPLNLNLISCEQFFDYIIDEPWAKYSFIDNNDQEQSGNLAIKGVMDLVYQENDETLGYLDYKSGKRLNFATGKEKDTDSLYKDFQLRLYHYALFRLFPNYKYLVMTLFFNNDGGPFTILLGKDDLDESLKIIKNGFQEIKRNNKPKRNPLSNGQSWKCKYLCDFYKIKDLDSPYYTGHNPDVNICDTMYNELQELGMDRVVNKYADLKKINVYTDGGGQQNRQGVK